jgi:hypothetical protein
VFEAWKRDTEAFAAEQNADAGKVPERRLSGPPSGAPPGDERPGWIWDCFTVYLERLMKIPAEFEKGPANLTESPLAAFAYAYAALSLLRPIIGSGANGADAVSLAVHWQLDRKLREILTGLGIEGDAPWHGVQIMKAVLRRIPPMEAKSGKKAKAAAGIRTRRIILDNYSDEEFRRILGINVFDDITWFNKEAFERILVYGPVFAAMEGADFTAIKETRALLKKAEAKSGYRLDRFLNALVPAVKPAGKTARKTSGESP